MLISRDNLVQLYQEKKLSMKQIADTLHCSVHGIQYWMQKYNIPSRTISEGAYIKHNPTGDPFKWLHPKNAADHRLYGMGIGLYWGEGTKSCLSGVRLGNSDPKLLKIFMQFMQKFFGVEKQDFRFGLQIFSDIVPRKALAYWIRALGVHRKQFHATIVVTKSGSLGTYRKKSPYGVVTVHYHNKKLRDMLNAHLAAVAQG